MKICKMSECDRVHSAKGYCKLHYSRVSKWGSPGSLLPRVVGESPTNHGMFPTWSGMRQRCNNPKAPSYKDYGGRGIKVCDRWEEPRGKGFWNFLEDMGERPRGMSIDRIDNDKGYSPENCRWATPHEQMFNTRSKLTLSYDFSTIEEDFDWK